MDLGMRKAFLLASLFLVLIVLLVIKQGSTPAWARYQEEYFAEQIAQLKQQLASVQDKAKRSQIEQEIINYQQRKPEIVNLILPNGKVERCKTCHLGIEEISSSHPSNALGCTICHGGNPLSLDETTAHAQMYGGGHPGSLDVADLSCGGVGPNGETCHSGNQDQAKNEVDLVKTSIMATKAGELSAVRQMFGMDKTQKVPGLTLGEQAIQYPHPLQGRPDETAFQQNCLNQCHQNGGKLPVDTLVTKAENVENKGSSQGNNDVRGYGCETCHVLTNPSHTYVGSDVTMKNAVGYGMVHNITTEIPYTQCNQCHNQGYHDPLKMTFAFRSDMAKVVRDWLSGDSSWADRVSDYYLPGEIFAKCEVSLDCIDCHTRQDVMGDNKLYTSQYTAVHIQCMDCHGTKDSLPLSKKIESADDPAYEDQLTNSNFPPLKFGDEIGLTAKGEELPFVRRQGTKWTVTSRVTGKTFQIPLVYGSQCQQNAADQGADSCHRCHDQSAQHP
jgi:hypothetical protein